MSRTHAVVDSPVGPLTVVTDDGALVGLYLAEHAHRPADVGPPGPVPTAVAEQLGEYFSGRRREFDLPVRLVGTPFQQLVWQALRGLPYGTTTTYGELAARVGRPGAARAVGLANGRNPVSIVVPCHRVVGADGGLTGYAGGLARKQALLALERASTA